MSAILLYQELQRALKLELHAKGFKGSGPNYRRNFPEITWIISIQKSDTCTAERLKLTVNIGIWSKQISVARGMGEKPPSSVYNCHASTRIGSFGPKPFDIWWTLYEESDLVACVSQICGLLETNAFPQLAPLTSGEALLNEWLHGNSNFHPEFYNRPRFRELLESALSAAHEVHDGPEQSGKDLPRQ